MVEDEKLLADAVADGLRRRAMAVDVAYDGESAMERATVNDYDVVVLDRDLPKLSGDVVCSRLTEAGGTARILMLTAAGSVADRVTGLALGADDYLYKPFAFAELVARVQALGRRSRSANPPVLHWKDLRLDPHRRQVTRDGALIPLSRKEFAVLFELMTADGGVVPTEHLLEKAWDENIDPFTGVVRYTIMMLRRKLGEPAAIDTEPGIGYRLA